MPLIPHWDLLPYQPFLHQMCLQEWLLQHHNTSYQVCQRRSHSSNGPHWRTPVQVLLWHTSPASVTIPYNALNLNKEGPTAAPGASQHPGILSHHRCFWYTQGPRHSPLNLNIAHQIWRNDQVKVNKNKKKIDFIYLMQTPALVGIFIISCSLKHTASSPIPPSSSLISLQSSVLLQVLTLSCIHCSSQGRHLFCEHLKTRWK